MACTEHERGAIVTHGDTVSALVRATDEGNRGAGANRPPTDLTEFYGHTGNYS